MSKMLKLKKPKESKLSSSSRSEQGDVSVPVLKPETSDSLNFQD
jgi:hypothetical protein